MTEMRVEDPIIVIQVMSRYERRLQSIGSTERYSSSRSWKKRNSSVDKRNTAKDRDGGKIKPYV